MRRPGDSLSADGVRIDARVECGAVQSLRWVKGLYADPLVCFEAPRDGSPQAMWWRFKVRGAKGRRIWFHLANVPEILGGGGLDESVPVIREGGGAWRRLDPDSCRKLGPRGPFEFVVEFATDDAQLAWCYPYGPSDLARFLKALPAARRKHLRVARVARTAAGRSLRMISCGETRGGEPRPAVWVTARNHAGEVAGSHAAQGLIEELVSSHEEARWLRKHCAVHVVPFVDLDGVAEGRYGKDHVPRDFNRDWSARPVRAEVRALIRAIESSRRFERPLVFIDLHCPGAGEVRSYPVLPNPTGLADWQKIAFLAKCAERFAPPDFPMRVRDWPRSTINWASWLSPGTTANWARDAGMTALTFELTYQRTRRGNLATPELYRGFGRGLVRALAAFLRHEISGRRVPATPVPRVPRAAGWLTRRLPVKARLAGGRDGAARITGRGEGSQVTLRTLRTLAASAGRRAAFVLETANSSRRAVTLNVVILPRTARGYWTGAVIERKVKVKPGRDRRVMRVAMKSPAAGFRVGFEVRDLAGRLDVCVGEL